MHWFLYCIRVAYGIFVWLPVLFLAQSILLFTNQIFIVHRWTILFSFLCANTIVCLVINHFMPAFVPLQHPWDVTDVIIIAKLEFSVSQLSRTCILGLSMSIVAGCMWVVKVFWVVLTHPVWFLFGSNCIMGWLGHNVSYERI